MSAISIASGTRPSSTTTPLRQIKTYLPQLSEFIFFGSVDISSLALDIFSLVYFGLVDSSSSVQWIYLLRLTGFVFFGFIL
jgi:hypothetical protein